MRFAYDTEFALDNAAALVNSAHGEVDALATTADLEDFVRIWRWSGAAGNLRAELPRVRALRPRLEELWHADEVRAAAIVNELLREAPTEPHLTRHDGWDWHLHMAADDAPLSARMAVEAAMGMVDLLRNGELDRLRVCAAEGCNDVMVDLSKNRSRRFCSARCANRTNMAAFRSRARENDAADS